MIYDLNRIATEGSAQDLVPKIMITYHSRFPHLPLFCLCPAHYFTTLLY
jgi:hypothetical protein